MQLPALSSLARRHAAQLALSLCAVAGLGCSSATTELVADVHGTEAPLFVETGDQVWPSGTIPVCFMTRWVPDGALQGELESSLPCFATMTARIRDTIEREYEAIPGAKIDFTGFGVCPNNIDTLPKNQRLDVNGGDSSAVSAAAAQLTPTFANGIKVGIQCDYNDDEGVLVPDTNGWASGSGYPNGGNVMLWTSQSGYAWPDGFDRATVHEFAHALGFSHEYDRTDQPDEQCQAHWVAGQGGHKLGYPDDGPGTHDGDFLTDYDPNSVTNQTYCLTENEGALSYLDRLGVAISYPASLSSVRPLGAASLQVQDGLLVRGDDVLLLDRAQLGATDQAYPTVRFHVGLNGNSPATQYHLATGSLPTSHSDLTTFAQVAVHAVDFVGRTHDGPIVGITNSDAKHAALLMTALP